MSKYINNNYKALLMATSSRFSVKVKLRFLDSDLKGKELVTLFLDTILPDNCSPEIQKLFLESVKEMLETEK